MKRRRIERKFKIGLELKVPVNGVEDCRLYDAEKTDAVRVVIRKDELANSFVSLIYDLKVLNIECLKIVYLMRFD